MERQCTQSLLTHFLGRTDNSNGCHLVLGEANGLYFRVLVPTPSRCQHPKFQAHYLLPLPSESHLNCQSSLQIVATTYVCIWAWISPPDEHKLAKSPCYGSIIWQIGVIFGGEGSLLVCNEEKHPGKTYPRPKFGT